MSKFILSIDQGTTGSQCSLFEIDTWKMFGNHKVEFPQIYPQPGYVEHNPEEIWTSVLKAIKLCLEHSTLSIPNFSPSQILGIGITNQRETIVAWNKETGETAGNAIVWQDKRTAKLCHSLKQDLKIQNMIVEKTGLQCDPYFSGTKILWLLENRPQCQLWRKKNQLCFGTIDSYLIYKLTGGKEFITDHTNSCRTLLYNLQSGDYDNDLMALFHIDRHCLPSIQPSSSHFGITHNVSELPNGIPILSAIGDQQSSLLAHHCTSKGSAKITFGSGAFLLVNTGSESFIPKNGLLSTVAYSFKDTRTFALEGAAFIAGSAIQWIRDCLSWISNSTESTALALSEPMDPNLLFVPSFSGLAAPFWNSRAKGCLLGISRGTTKSQITYAIMESLSLQACSLLELMAHSHGIEIEELKADGGLARSHFIMQSLANFLQMKVHRSQNSELTSLGAALASFSTLNNSLETNFTQESTLFYPTLPLSDARGRKESWKKAVDWVHSFYQE